MSSPKVLKIFIFFFLILFFLIPSISTHALAAKFVPGQILVQYQPGASPKELSQAVSKPQGLIGQIETLLGVSTPNPRLSALKQKLDNINTKIGAASLNPMFPGSSNPNLRSNYLIKLKANTNVLQAVSQLRQQTDLIKAVQPNYYIKAAAVTPNDPYYSSLQWNLQKVDMPDAWGITEGSNNVTVAVIDSGIDYNNPDFAGVNIIKGKNYVTCNSDPANPNNCIPISTCTQTANGYCNNNPMDDFGHGTHVAGIIAAATNNNTGISGIDWHVNILAIKILDDNGQGSSTSLGSAIQEAVASGAKIINLSEAGGSDTNPEQCSQQPVIQNIIDSAVQSGVLIVVAAGNGDYNAQTGQVTPSNSANVFPSSCNNVLVVGATNRYDQKASYSDYGSNVSISAPGGDWMTSHNAADGILSLKSSTCNTTDVCPAGTIYNNNYLFMQGTSMATPHVSGIAALLLANNPALSPQQLRNCLVNNADPIAAQSSIGPRVNAYKALLACQPSALPSPTQIPTLIPTPTNQPTLIPTLIPSPSITSLPSPIPSPTSTSPTPSPANSVSLRFNVLLDGIGSAGDAVNPNNSSQSNKNPQPPTRNLRVVVLQTGATPVVNQICPIQYDTTTGEFSTPAGQACNIGNLPAGTYEIKVKADGFLEKFISQGAGFTLADGQVINLPQVRLTAGDIDGNNVVDLNDYNLLISCYNDFGPPKCSSSIAQAADFDADGKVNAKDYNLFLREPHVSGN